MRRRHDQSGVARPASTPKASVLYGLVFGIFELIRLFKLY